MDMTKPHKGRISDWSKDYNTFNGLGYCIKGYSHDHPYFGGGQFHTSYVILHDETTGEIETNNSRYVLINSLPSQVDICLSEMKDEGFDDIIILGRKKQSDGTVRNVYRTSLENKAEIIYDFEIMKKLLLETNE